ncbi:MAG: hypothetical protein OHK0053_24400 [Microscillaceae bacterium]
MGGFFTQVAAQQSMEEVEKMRKLEEKRRAKLAKNQNLPASGGEARWSDGGKKAQKQARQKINKAEIPKASQKLSQEGKFRHTQRLKNRKGSEGLTKAAKNQIKANKRRQKALR